MLNIFYSCSSLSSITIPNSITSIGDGIFYDCSSLSSIDLPDSVTSIGGAAFSGCTSLDSIAIPNSVTSIGNRAFYDCTCLTSIYLPNSVTSIGVEVFNGCTSLSSINLPNSVTSIWSSAFEGCTSLTSIYLPNSVTSIGNRAFYGCTSLTSIYLPNSVTSIGVEVFNGCTSLSSINIPNSVTSIEVASFSGCTSLSSIDIPNSVTSIGASTFDGCSSLTSIDIPNSVTSIGEKAFMGCSFLWDIYFDGSETQWGQVTKGSYWKPDVTKEHWRCTVTFDSNGHGEAPGPQSNLWSNKSKAQKPDAPTASGLVFTGWYTDAACTTKWNFRPPLPGDMTLYAGWETGLQLSDNTANNLTAYDGQKFSVTLRGRTLYTDGSWNTLCLPFDVGSFTGTPLDGAIVKTLGSSSFANGTLTLNFSDDQTSIEAGRPYIVRWPDGKAIDDGDIIINSQADWDDFAAKMEDGTCTGRTVQLNADINVTKMVGTEAHPFSGVFEGNRHTISLNVTDESNQGTAPFRYISNATIQNVRTSGSVTGNLHCAGLVGFAWSGTNTISNCEVAADIKCSGGNHSHCGGILGHGKASNTTITDCLFSGSISGAKTATGVIYGWGDYPGVHMIKNCLANGTYDGGGISLLRKDGGWESITNCYCTTEACGQGFYTDATGGDLATLLGSGWEVSSDNVVPKKNYIPIDNPVFNSVIVSSTTANVETTCANFIGTYTPVSIGAAGNNNTLYFSKDNMLYRPKTTKTINPFRAYLLLTNGLVNSDSGDVNGDKLKSVTDVTMLVNNILGKSDDNFIVANGDVNGDGQVNVTDVTALVNIILGGKSIVNVVVNGADGITFGGGGTGPARVAGNHQQDD